MSELIDTTTLSGDLGSAWSRRLRWSALLVSAFSIVPVAICVALAPTGGPEWASIHELFEGLALAFSLFGMVLARLRLQREVEPSAAAVAVVFVIVAVSGAIHSAISMGLFAFEGDATSLSWSVVLALSTLAILGGAVFAGWRRSFRSATVAKALIGVSAVTVLVCVAVLSTSGEAAQDVVPLDYILATCLAGVVLAWSAGQLELARGPQGEALILCTIPLAVMVVHDLIVSGRHGQVEGAVSHYLEIVVLSTLLAGILTQYSEVHRRQSEVKAALRSSRSKLDAAHVERDRVFAASTDLICYANTDGYFVELNPAWEAVLGWTMAELKSRPFVEFVHPDDREKTAAETGLLKHLDHRTHRFVNRYQCRDGSFRWLQWNAVGGGVSDDLIVAIARDVTDDREIQDRLEKYASDLARSNSELEQFAHVASHDLQEPLRKVQSFADLLMHRYATEISDEPMGYIRRMAAATERMQNLIRDLLSLSRLSSQDVPDEPVDLAFTVQVVLSDLEVAVREADCQVTVGDLPVIIANPRQVQQLLLNLVSNAVKYRRSGVPAEVSISAEIADGGPVIVVRDNGIGFEPKYADRIFEIFERVSGTDHEGTGIGLALCRRIMQRHGGTIAASGEPGLGATFRASFPASRAAREEVSG